MEEARHIITYYHANGDANHPICDMEMNEISQSLEAEGMTTFRTFFDLRVLVKSRSRAYRLMLCMAMAWFGQFSGNNIASYYLPIMLKNVGITSVDTQLLLNIIYALTGWIAASSGARFHDIVGRRKMMMGSCAGMAVCLAIVAGTAADFENTGSTPASKASIAFIFIFGSVFAFAFTSMQPIYPAEVLSSESSISFIPFQRTNKSR
jgi:MFS family permease